MAPERREAPRNAGQRVFQRPGIRTRPDEGPARSVRQSVPPGWLTPADVKARVSTSCSCLASLPATAGWKANSIFPPCCRASTRTPTIASRSAKWSKSRITNPRGHRHRRQGQRRTEPRPEALRGPRLPAQRSGARFRSGGRPQRSRAEHRHRRRCPVPGWRQARRRPQLRAPSTARQAHWLAVNQQLTPSPPQLTLEWVQRKYLSVLTQQPDRTYKYVSRLKETVRDTRKVQIAAGGSNFALPTQEPGDFILVLRNSAGAELNRLSYSVAGDANISRSLERNAELQIQLDKPAYAGGDTISVSIRAPMPARASSPSSANAFSITSGSRPLPPVPCSESPCPGFRRQRLRERAVPARSRFRRNLHEPAFLWSGAVRRRPVGAHPAGAAHRARQVKPGAVLAMHVAPRRSLARRGVCGG
jgi:hypothetical protein